MDKRDAVMQAIEALRRMSKDESLPMHVRVRCLTEILRRAYPK